MKNTRFKNNTKNLDDFSYVIFDGRVGIERNSHINPIVKLSTNISDPVIKVHYYK